MSIRIIPAIMSGGAGTRLWPASTDTRPKQFHALGGETPSLFAAAVRRVSGVHGALSFAPPIVLCNVGHADLVRAHLGGAQASAIVLEPAPRNTAAVGVIAAAVAAKLDPGALVLLSPSDHLIADAAAFHAAIERAAPFARERIVTFGITPDRPATGYGYIKTGAELGEGVFAIERFREKPDAATARAYIDEGGHAWNAGIFLFAPRTLLNEFDHAPAIRDAALRALNGAVRDGVEIRLDPLLFSQIPSQSLDIAVMEKTDRAAVAPSDFGWADIGAWDEIWRLSPKDAGGNATHGPVAALDAANNLIRGDGVKICVAGVSDLVIVATPEAVIILPRDRAQDVKTLKQLAEKL